MHPEAQALYEICVATTQGEEDMDTQERYYILSSPLGNAWELWECLPDGNHALRASFYDGNDKTSPLAEIILPFLNAIAEVGKTEEGEQDAQ